MEPKQIGRRTFLMALLNSVALGGLAFRLGGMQLVDRERWTQTSTSQSMRRVDLFAPRGEIVDVKGRRLATNRPAQAAYLIYPAYKDSELVKRVCTLLQADYKRVSARIQEKINAELYWEPVLVKDDITDIQFTTLAERRDVYQGVLVQTHPIREYPYGSLGSHVLGYVLQASEEDMKADPMLKPGALVGQAGLEARFDKLLRGRPGEKLLQIHRDYTPTGVEQVTKDVEPGQNLHLTIDAELQDTAERALVKTLQHIQVTVNYDPNPSIYKNAKAGAVVAMDIKTGGILAMVSHPDYDPNWFITGDDRVTTLFSDSKWAPLFERSIRAHYNPASTWKMLTSLAGVTTGVIGSGEPIYCSGTFKKVEPPPHCWVYPTGHGNTSMRKAISTSCDVYFYELGMRLGIDNIVNMAKKFGFGSKTGVDLPLEYAGWLPDEVARAELAKEDTPWTPGETLFAAIGQKLSVTPLQLARYVCTLATRNIYRPQIVAKAGDLAPGEVPTVKPDILSTLEIDEGTMQIVRDGMLGVTQAGGTAEHRFQVLGIPVCGKTGTAEVYGEDNYGVFVAYAPADNPQIAVAVVGEQAGHGDSLIPVIKAVMAKHFGIKLPPTDEAWMPDQPLQPVVRHA